MAQVVDLATYRRKRVAGDGGSGTFGGFVPASTPATVHDLPVDRWGLSELFDDTVWQNWILLTVLTQCVQLSSQLGMQKPRIDALRRAGAISQGDTIRVGICISRFLRPNRPLPRSERMFFLQLSRRIERQLRSAGERRDEHA